MERPPSFSLGVVFVLLALLTTAYAVFSKRLRQECVQKYYAYLGIYNRHKPYESSIWNEKDDETLLWKVSALTGRSASAIMTLFGVDVARVALLNFVYFRVLDTWADVCIRREDRIPGLELLPKRLKRLEEERVDETTTRIAADDTSSIVWDFASRERNRAYVDITKNAHRFDKVFLSLSPKHKRVTLEYVNSLSTRFSELELLQDAPVTPELMRKHAEAALDVGAMGLFEACGADDLAATIKAPSSKNGKVLSDAYIAYSDFMWYMNLSATILEDVKEGVLLDEELRAMSGVDLDVIERVRCKWLIIALQRLGESEHFLFHPFLLENWVCRMVILQFLNISVDCCVRYLPTLVGNSSYKKSSAFVGLLKTSWHSLRKPSYSHAASLALKKGGELLVAFEKKAHSLEAK